MYAGMTRNETRGLLVLIVLIIGGVGFHALIDERERGAVWVEHTPQISAKTGAGALPGISNYPKPGGMETPLAGAENLGTERRLDLNKATALELESCLPGVGLVKAQAIVELRRQRGGFRDVRELLEVSGIGEKTFERLAPLVFVATAATSETATAQAGDGESGAGVAPPATPEPSPVATPVSSTPLPRAGLDTRININTATAAELETLYRIGPITAAKIIEHRRTHGPFRRVEDFMNVPGIGEKILEQNRDKIRVD
jgi:competence ComEA-like helix-hairpin-helix protein